ncbi:hypothetical protein [Promicromonospora sp. NPDC057488]|uniref:hypothetical protein n=1 Tax=Promicromonospora sp. NPDC057488 TaxID=3346147 RepID=UPI0036726E42
MTAPLFDDQPGAVICRAYGSMSRAAVPSKHGTYCAVLDLAPLPAQQESDHATVLRGAAVDVGDRWAFFDDLATAASFARAGRMSNLTPSWDLFEAAQVRAYCPEHGGEELALLLGRQVYERTELRTLANQFAATAAETLSWSS